MLSTCFDHHVLHICVEVSHEQLLDGNQNLLEPVVIGVKCGGACL